MNKTVKTILCVIAAVAACAAVVCAVIRYKEQIASFFSSLKDKVSEKRFTDEEYEDFADI